MTEIQFAFWYYLLQLILLRQKTCNTPTTNFLYSWLQILLWRQLSTGAVSPARLWNLSLKVFKTQPEKVFINLAITEFRLCSGQGIKVISQGHFQLEWFSSILGNEIILSGDCHGETLSFHLASGLLTWICYYWTDVHTERKRLSIISVGHMTN